MGYRPGGNVGIGTSTPSVPLSVSGNAYFAGNVGVGTARPGQPLQVVGNLQLGSAANTSGATGGTLRFNGGQGTSDTAGTIAFYGEGGNLLTSIRHYGGNWSNESIIFQFAQDSGYSSYKDLFTFDRTGVALFGSVNGVNNGQLTIYNSSVGATTAGLILGNMKSNANSNIEIEFKDYNSNIISSIQSIYSALQTGSLTFSTANAGTAAEAMRITATGLIGIGTTSPWRKLSVTGTVGFDGVGSTGGTQTLCLSDNKEVVTNNGACTSSSELFKHDIATLSIDGIDLLSTITPSSFIYNNDTSSTTRWGFIAQQLASTSPHFIDYYDTNGNPRTIDTTSILAVTVKALQELIAKVAGFAEKLVTKHIEADDGNFKNKLCVGSTCITESQLQTFLNQSAQQVSAPQQATGNTQTEHISPGFATSTEEWQVPRISYTHRHWFFNTCVILFPFKVEMVWRHFKSRMNPPRIVVEDMLTNTLNQLFKCPEPRGFSKLKFE